MGYRNGKVTSISNRVLGDYYVILKMPKKWGGDNDRTTFKMFPRILDVTTPGTGHDAPRKFTWGPNWKRVGGPEGGASGRPGWAFNEIRFVDLLEDGTFQYSCFAGQGG